MCMRVICQKNLARLLDCVGALKHEAKWRDAAQSEPNTTHYDNADNHFSLQLNLMKKSMICSCVLCVLCVFTSETNEIEK